MGSISESGRFPWRRKWQPNSSILAWEIPWTEEPDRLPSIESQRVGHDSTSEHALTYFTTITKERGKGGLCRLRNFSTEKRTPKYTQGFGNYMHFGKPRTPLCSCPLLHDEARLQLPYFSWRIRKVLCYPSPLTSKVLPSRVSD